MIKYILEQNGIEYEMFSQWESKARYVLGYLIGVEKIDKAIQEIEKYLTMVSAEINK